MLDPTNRRTVYRLAPALLILFGCGAGTDREERAAAVAEGAVAEEAAPVEAGIAAQRAFFDALRALCGQSFAGSTSFVSAPDHPRGEGTLRMIVESCTDTEIRIPFHVEDDRSRTWILTRTADGLLFKHDHRHEDGTPEDLTDYGGWATLDGTASMQRFPADAETAEMLPEAATNVWTLQFDAATHEFIYDLTRHGEPRFRASFDLSAPLPPPAQ